MNGRQLHFGTRDDNGPLLSRGLETLTDLTSDSDTYRAALNDLGWGLARRMVDDMGDVRGKMFFVAATAEDLDGLGTGFIRALQDAGATVSIACLWIHRTKVQTPDPIDVAQIVREYVEPAHLHVDHFIALKSIIATSCVIRTSILRMLDEFEPSHIHVVAPVMLAGADQRLEEQFPAHLAKRFRYWMLAEDRLVDDLGNVEPGVGGNVYERLGFSNQAAKNAFIPAYLISLMGPAPERSMGSSFSGP